MFKRKRSEENPSVFMGLVELHERNWGTDSYSERPRLSDILDAPVVVFWHSTDKNEARNLITLHDDLKQLSSYVEDMFLSQNTRRIDRRFSRIYLNREEIKIKGLRLIFDRPEK